MPTTNSSTIHPAQRPQCAVPAAPPAKAQKTMSTLSTLLHNHHNLLSTSHFHYFRTGGEMSTLPNTPLPNEHLAPSHDRLAPPREPLAARPLPPATGGAKKLGHL